MRETVTRLRGSLERGARATLSPAGVRGIGIEIAACAAHVAMYPLGVLRERMQPHDDRYTIDNLPPVQRGLLIGDVEAAGTPIVLVHGWVDNRAVFTFLRRALRRRGFGRIVTINYSIVTHDVRRAARRLGMLVEQLCEETGYERVHVVGHSMGGVVARYYVQRLGGDARVHTLATLGSPHGGTWPARLPLGRTVRQLRPGSEVLRELAEPSPDCRTRFVAVWSDFDQLVIPKRSGRIEHPDLNVRNVFVRGVGHASLPVDRRVVREIVGAFAHLDSHGSTIAASVTPIASTMRAWTPPRERRSPTTSTSRKERSVPSARSSGQGSQP